MLWPQSSRLYVIWITQQDTLSQSMRDHFVSIENTCYHQLLSTMTQSIGIYDHFRVSPIGYNLLLTLAQVQYSLKVKSPCSIVLCHDSLQVMSNVHHIQQCTYHGKVISMAKRIHLSNQEECNTISDRLPKSMHRLQITHHFTRNPYL